MAPFLAAALLAASAGVSSARAESSGDLAADLAAAAPALDRAVLSHALDATERARAAGLAGGSPLLTVIDYSRPSTERRLWVFDLERRRLLFEELVAHGKGTGENLAVRFSNDHRSLATSLGLFRTAETYTGANGYSLRLDGLEPGFNDRARERTIVMHGAPYVSEAFARRHGRLGRSWGCPALDRAVARRVIDTIRGGSLVFAYGPDPRWLQVSGFVGSTLGAF
jgi:hypothetical protein